MISLHSDHDPRLIRSIDCGLLDVSDETRSLIPEKEWKAALHRHLHLDFGDMDLEGWIGNLFGISMLKTGIVVSHYSTSIGRSLKIQTDLTKEETKVFLE